MTTVSRESVLELVHPCRSMRAPSYKFCLVQDYAPPFHGARQAEIRLFDVTHSARREQRVNYKTSFTELSLWKVEPSELEGQGQAPSADPVIIPPFVSGLFSLWMRLPSLTLTDTHIDSD